MRLMMLMGSLLLAALAAQSGTAQDKPAEDKIVCKRNYHDYTGSHLSRPKKVCMKASEWKLQEDGADRAMRRIQDSGAQNPDKPAPMGGGPG